MAKRKATDDDYASYKRPNSSSVQSASMSSSADTRERPNPYSNSPNSLRAPSATSSSTSDKNTGMSNKPQASNSDDLSKISEDLKTKRSKHFLTEIASVNHDLIDWLRSALEENAEVLLTRVFRDHQRHVQKLFDEERKLDMTEEQLRILDNQEKVLHMLTERKADLVFKPSPETELSTKTTNGPQFFIPVTSNGTVHKTNSPFTLTSPIAKVTSCTYQHSNTETSAMKFPRAEEQSANKSESDAASKNVQNGFHFKPSVALEDKENKKTSDKPALPTPFFTSNALANNTGKSALNNGLMNNSSKMVNPFFQSPTNVLGQSNDAVKFGAVTFSSVVNAPAKTAEEEPDEDQPPVVEVTPVVEDGAIYTKRCKVFMKKETGDGYEDRGVGNLFLKPVADTSKTQLIIRADTNLGNLIVNVILSSDLPVKKMNATNAMIVCVPAPGSPLRTVLIRVKTGPDCDELIEKLLQCQASN